MHLNRGFSPALWMAVGLGIVSAWSQTVHPPDTAFDVASIKPARPEARGYSIRPFPGRLSAENVTLKLLIAEAYHVYDFQISGPKWIDSERYDLEAKIGGDPPPSKAQLRAMLQKLLADRPAIIQRYCWASWFTATRRGCFRAASWSGQPTIR